MLKTRTAIMVSSLLVIVAPSASAQDFGVLESAETINEGNFKLGVYPLFALPDEGDTDFILPVSFGYGFTESFDVEGRVAFSDHVTFIGGDAEYWFVKNRPLDVSLRGGFHVGLVDGELGDTTGFDVSVIASAPVARRVEIIGALDLAFNSIDLGADNDGFTTAHLVPGIEIAVTPDLDFVGEFGIGITDESSNYVAFGLAFYIR